MGLFSLLPVIALIYAFFTGNHGAGGHDALPIAPDHLGLGWLALGQAAIVALLLVTSIKLARGRRRPR